MKDAVQLKNSCASQTFHNQNMESVSRRKETIGLLKISEGQGRYWVEVIFCLPLGM